MKKNLPEQESNKDSFVFIVVSLFLICIIGIVLAYFLYFKNKATSDNQKLIEDYITNFDKDKAINDTNYLLLEVSEEVEDLTVATKTTIDYSDETNMFYELKIDDTLISSIYKGNDSYILNNIELASDVTDELIKSYLNTLLTTYINDVLYYDICLETYEISDPTYSLSDDILTLTSGTKIATFNKFGLITSYSDNGISLKASYTKA